MSTIDAIRDDAGSAGLQPVSAGERQAQIVMAVDLMDPASRARARQTIDALGKGSVSVARSRMLDKQILALAQADSGSARIAAELQKLAAKARELDSSFGGRRRKGLLGRVFKPAEKKPKDVATTIRELEGIVDTLSGSAEVLRQNNVALDGYEADIGAESQKVAAEIAMAEDFHAALSAAIDRARLDGTPSDVIRFATHEVLFPLEQHRQYLQSLLAVNQQAAFSLAMLRDTNTALIGHVRQIVLATKSSLGIATTLRRFSAERGDAARYDGTQGGGAASGQMGSAASGVPGDAASGVAALQDSLDKLFLALDRHDAWQGQVAAKTSEAVSDLRQLSAEVFES